MDCPYCGLELLEWYEPDKDEYGYACKKCDYSVRSHRKLRVMEKFGLL